MDILVAHEGFAPAAQKVLITRDAYTFSVPLKMYPIKRTTEVGSAELEESVPPRPDCELLPLPGESGRSTCPEVGARRSSEAASVPCAITAPNEVAPKDYPKQHGTGVFGNASLATVLQGAVTWRPENGTDADGYMEMKWWWWRGIPGKLIIEGRRLDRPAPPLRAWIPDGYHDRGSQPVSLLFPTEGCWEITGKVGDASLTFVTRFVKQSD